MNRQVGYIAYAHVILTAVAFGCLVISKIPPNSFEEESSEAFCGTVNPLLSEKEYKGKGLFQSKCAACHHVFKDMTGPALMGIEERGPWTDRRQLYNWIRNPEAFMKSNPYTRGLNKQYGSVMTAFPNLSDEEIDTILDFIKVNSSPAIP